MVWADPLAAQAAAPVVMAIQTITLALALLPSPSTPCRAMLAEMAEGETVPEEAVVARARLAKTV